MNNASLTKFDIPVLKYFEKMFYKYLFNVSKPKSNNYKKEFNQSIYIYIYEKLTNKICLFV